jgi:hypothetical protein
LPRRFCWQDTIRHIEAVIQARCLVGIMELAEPDRLSIVLAVRVLAIHPPPSKRRWPELRPAMTERVRSGGRFFP